jgi:RpiB/LacA/LacB family sugar-phosphate isomerase
MIHVEHRPAIYIGSDHAGFQLKSAITAFLKRRGYEVMDMGPDAYDAEDDYPDYAAKVCRSIIGTENKGILICGSGQGMDRAANKFPGIYASVCWNSETARIAKEHGNVNVLCLPGRMTKEGTAKRMVGIWLDRPFSGEERHKRRIMKTKAIEDEQRRK